MKSPLHIRMDGNLLVKDTPSHNYGGKDQGTEYLTNQSINY